MARPYRLQGENCFYHITSRGDDRKKIYVNPRYAFVILSIVLGLFIVLLLPTLYRILIRDHPDGFDYKTVLPDELLFDGVVGVLTGIIFSIVGLSRFDTAKLVQLIRLFLLIIVSLTFLTYITIKSLM